jgi:hypothetical protein
MSNDPPALSVVICSTGEKTLGETVESVQAAASAAKIAVEVIVGWQSSDEPPALPGARVLHLLPVSLSYARNRGLEASRSRFVAFVDADEVVGDSWVAATLATLEGDARPKGCFGPIEPRPGEQGIPHCAFTGAEPRLIRGTSAPPWTVGSGGNMAFDRASLIALGGFDLLLGAGAIGLAAEDTDVIVGLLKRGATLAWSPEMTVFHPTKTEAERLASRFPYAFGLGRVVRRERSGELAVRQIHSLVLASIRALGKGNRRLLRENWAGWSGFLQGLLRRLPWVSPPKMIDFLPQALREDLGRRAPSPLPAAFRPDPHFIYDCGDGRLLHAYVNPSDRLRSAIEDRDRISRETTASGIPKVLSSAAGIDSFWVIEERIPGTHPSPARAEEWLDPVAEWAVELGGALDVRLGDTPEFVGRRAELLAGCSDRLRPALEGALDAVSDLPAAHVQGDLEAKNILLDSGRIAAIDWEAAQARGMPGIDLVFLVLTALDDPLDGSTVTAIASGDAALFRHVERLERVGIGRDRLRPALLVMLALWAADERRRLAVIGRAGGEPAPPLFGPMLERRGPLLVEPSGG